ncbi:MAG TPA: N-acetylmuramoyl-L-alanine amidase [candidate division Zixibacteria bacterium]|nr:N-acetylmuramoyl-L-alanine amidase [candidate division Zixibacteria bacterium]
METLERTKARLIREAIERNLELARPLQARRTGRARRLLPVCLWGCFLAAGLGYLYSPAPVVSEATSPSPGLETPEVATAPGPAEGVAPAEAVEPELPVSPPQALHRAVLPLSVRRIVVDPGHGGRQHGAISQSGVSEKHLTLEIALRLRRLLEQASFQAILTREGDQTLPLDKRVAFANASRADLFVSIHVNWMEQRELRPLETYYVGPTDDPAAMRLAGIENRESGYSLADYRELLEKVYMHARRDESRRLAETIHAELYHALRESNPGLDNRGVKKAPFVVLIGTQMPAILVEVASLANEDDVRLLTNPDYQEKIAQALLRGIRAYADGLNGSAKKGG